MRLKVLGEQHPDVQLARVRVARLLQQRGTYAEADTHFTQALTARRAALGNSSPAVAASLIDEGILVRFREDWPGAEASFREAAPIRRAARIQDQKLYTLSELGRALAKQDKFDQADTMLTEGQGMNTTDSADVDCRAFPVYGSAG